MKKKQKSTVAQLGEARQLVKDAAAILKRLHQGNRLPGVGDFRMERNVRVCIGAALNALNNSWNSNAQGHLDEALECFGRNDDDAEDEDDEDDEE
jgi:hypothetical protein